MLFFKCEGKTSTILKCDGKIHGNIFCIVTICDIQNELGKKDG